MAGTEDRAAGDLPPDLPLTDPGLDPGPVSTPL